MVENSNETIDKLSAAENNNSSDIQYLTPIELDTKKEKMYCRFKKAGIKYVDYKDTKFLSQFINPQGKILPRRYTGTSSKYQKQVSTAIKRARFLALMPYIDDILK